MHRVFNLSLSVDNTRYIRDMVSIWHYWWGQCLQKQLFFSPIAHPGRWKVDGITYCRGWALTKWSRFWFFAFSENKSRTLFLLFLSSWVASQCEHMVKGKEGLKLTHNLMAAPGFELVVEKKSVPSFPSFLSLKTKPNVSKCERPQQSNSEEEEQLWTRRCALQVTLFSAASL